MENKIGGRRSLGLESCPLRSFMIPTATFAFLLYVCLMHLAGVCKWLIQFIGLEGGCLFDLAIVLYEHTWVE